MLLCPTRQIISVHKESMQETIGVHAKKSFRNYIHEAQTRCSTIELPRCQELLSLTVQHANFWVRWCNMHPPENTFIFSAMQLFSRSASVCLSCIRYISSFCLVCSIRSPDYEVSVCSLVLAGFAEFWYGVGWEQINSSFWIIKINNLLAIWVSNGVSNYFWCKGKHIIYV